MVEVGRKLFVSLNKDGNMYYVLNDQNFVFKFFAQTIGRAELIFEAWCNGGYREKYAVENGVVNFADGSHKNCIKFIIPNEPQSDSNGALYHIIRKEWVG